MSDPSQRLSRVQFDDMTRVSAGVVALADWLEELVGTLALRIGEQLGIDPADIPMPPTPPAIEKLRLRALQTSRAEELERVTERIAANKLAAMKSSRLPASRPRYEEESHGDGSSWGKNAERDRLLAGSQAARHAELAKTYAPDASDVHRDTRPIRERLYEQMAREAEEAQ